MTLIEIEEKRGKMKKRNQGNYVTQPGRAVHRKVGKSVFSSYACGVISQPADLKTRRGVSCKRCLKALKKK